MTFLPALNLPVLVVLLIALLAAIWWNPTARAVPGESAGTHWRLSSAAVLLFLAALRPGLPGDELAGAATNLNVYFVVDTTTSIVAEDFGPGRPRLDGVRSDILAIVRDLPGARYSILTFDADARVRLPLTADTTALEAAVETFGPEPSEFSRGSSVTVANDRLETLLSRSDARHPERGRVVFYLGDGEQTAPGDPAPFRIPKGLVQGGSVLGYGTADGGPMATTLSRYGSGDDHVKDPSTGEDAISVIDEARLKAIAAQLGVGYLHRSAGDPSGPMIAGIDLARFGTTEQLEQARVRGRNELYWPLLLGVGLIGTWELGVVLTSLRATGRRRQAS